MHVRGRRAGLNSLRLPLLEQPSDLNQYREPNVGEWYHSGHGSYSTASRSHARIPDDKDGNQTATARQMDDARQLAERKGWEVLDVFEDVDISAFDTKAKRPEFERMLAAIRDRQIDGVVVWKLDRLTRQQRDLSRVLEACRPHGAFVASVTEPIDTRETYGQFIAELLIAQARMESANTSVRQKRKALEQARLGDPPAGGSRCFGYERGYARIVPQEAALIREARDRALPQKGMLPEKV